MDNYTYIPPSIIAEIVLEYSDGTTERIITDEQWQCGEGTIITSDLYDGEVCDGRRGYENFTNVEIFSADKENLIPQEGEIVSEHECIKPISVLTTPIGETVIDFGQNITGYIKTEVTAQSGEIVDLSFAEVLDKNGNFYNENYRSAKSEYRYVCKDGKQIYKPSLCFYGFRYVRINSFPKGCDADCLTAVAVYSDIKQTGSITFESPNLNKLFQI